MKRKNVGAMSIKGGQKESFYFCLLEYFYEKDRWFLSGLHHAREGQVADEEIEDETILRWIKDNGIGQLVVDFPLTPPPCATCLPECQGEKSCPRPEVQRIREMMGELLDQDLKKIRNDPKKYEFERKENDIMRLFPRYMSQIKSAEASILSRPFKRRLKKGFRPYWNRPVDFWVWTEYYDQMLKYMNTSFDSFGQTSLMLVARFNYLRRHFPSHLKLYESPVPIILLELLRSEIISPHSLVNLMGIESCAQDRLKLIHQVEKTLKVFIYDHDVDILVKNPKAFNSFLLSLAGQKLLQDEIRGLPEWTSAHEAHFLVPCF